MTLPGPATRPAADPDPIPLQVVPAPIPFPVEVFPEPISRMVTEVAEATQTDPAMAGTAALTVLAALAGGHVEVEARRGWREVLALHTATIAPPAERKSAVQHALVGPLYDVEEELAEKGAEERAHAATKAEIAAARVSKLKADAGRAPTRDAERKLTEEALVAAQEARDITVPAIPRMVADDVTPEAISGLLAEQGGHLAVISSEGGLFGTIAGRYAAGVANLDAVLKGHDGDPIRVDRKGRDPEFIRRPVLTIGLMVQPQVIESNGRRDDFRGRGLLARFLYAAPQSKVGHRLADPPPVREITATTYAVKIRRLAQALFPLDGRDNVLTLDRGAQQLLVELQEAVEPALVDPDQLGTIADWGGKLVGTVVRIAGLLHLAAGGASSISKPITRAELQAAAQLGDYYRIEAIRAFSQMQIDPGTADAIYLLDRLHQHNAEEISTRDLVRLARRFHTVAELDAPVQRLLDTGWLIEGEAPKHSGPGRPPAPRYRLHPNIHQRRLRAV